MTRSATARLLAVLAAVMLLLVAACGDDGGSDAGPADAGDSPAAGTGGDTGSAPSDVGDGGSGSGGGSVTIGGETIQLDSARCFLQEQESAGQTIELTGQATGTNAAGEPVVVDFTRFAASSDFAGDDITVTIGDPFSPDAENLRAALDIGAVTLDGTTLSASGLEFTSEDGQGGIATTAGAFEIDC